MSATHPPSVSGPPSSETPAATDGGLRRRPVPVHYDWHVTSGGADGGDAHQESEVIYEDEPPTVFETYFGIFSDYVYWILLAYCASNVLIWIGEQLGLISPHFEEWMPVRWWHSNPHSLQQELYENATLHSLTGAQFEALKTWIEGGTGGWVSPKLLVSDYLSERGRYDRRLEVRERVEKDEVLVKLPLSHVLSSDFCQQDPEGGFIQQVLEAQKKSSENIDIAPWTWITLYMVAHTQKETPTAAGESWGFDSLLRNEYIDAALSYMPVFWDDESLNWLNGTDFLNVHVLDVHAAIESEYHKLNYLVPSVGNAITIIEFKKWAMVVLSRGETVELPDRENTSRTAPQLAIMPLIDLLDHHLPLPTRQLHSDDDLHKWQESESHTNISYSTELSAVVLRAQAPLTPQAAVTGGYGVRSNADYLLYHGFTMPREWSDLTVCTQHGLIELPLPADLPSWKSRFLSHPYRFAVPACPSDRSTPHVLVGAARFLVATEKDVTDFEEQAMKDPSLLPEIVISKDEKFLHHSAREALTVVCDTKAQPPVCRSPLSIENEKAAWALIKKQTVARIAQHIGAIDEDTRSLQEDDEKNTLSVNQRHAVIVRREEKITLSKWCAVSVFTAEHLETVDPEELSIVRLPDTVHLENEEPRVRPRYWRRLLEKISEERIPIECKPKR